MTAKLVIDGDFDAAKVEKMRDELDQIAEGDADLEIDMTRSRFLDSSGVGAIVFLYKRMKARGYTVCVGGLDGQPLKLLTHLGVAGLLSPRGQRAA